MIENTIDMGSAVSNKRFLLFVVLMASGLVLLGICMTASMASGPIMIPLKHAFALLLHHDQSVDNTILYSSRLPRTLIGALAGAAFAVSGAIMQGISRNPLACPSLLGINQGAALCIIVMLLFFPTISTALFIPFAFMGGILAALLIYSITATAGLSPLRLALAGIIVNALFHAVSRGLLLLFPDEAQATVFSIMGSLAGRSWMHFNMVLPWILIGLILSCFCYRQLNVLCLGDDEAQGLGLSAQTTQFILMGIAVMLAAAAVSVVGPVPFIGLIIPSAIRYFMPDYKYLIPLSMVFGALLLVFADTLIRLINPVVEIPVGIIAALLGGPFFVIIARSQAKGGAT